MFVFGWALAVLSGTFNVFFQDTQHLAEVGFQILFYLTPIIYRLQDLPRHRLGWRAAMEPGRRVPEPGARSRCSTARCRRSNEYLYAGGDRRRRWRRSPRPSSAGCRSD